MRSAHTSGLSLTADAEGQSLTAVYCCLAAERAAVGARVQRLAAVPAEPRGRRLARPQPRLDALRRRRAGAPPAAGLRLAMRRRLRRARAARRRQHVLEQIGRPLVARGRLPAPAPS